MSPEEREQKLENLLREYDNELAETMRQTERHRLNRANRVRSKKGLTMQSLYKQLVSHLPRLETVQQKRLSPILEQFIVHDVSDPEVDITKFEPNQGYQFLPIEDPRTFTEEAKSPLKGNKGYTTLREKHLPLVDRVFFLNPYSRTTLGHELFCLEKATFTPDKVEQGKFYFANGSNRVFVKFDENNIVTAIGTLPLDVQEGKPNPEDRYGPIVLGEKIDIDFSDIAIDYGTLNPLQPSLEFIQFEGDYFVAPVEQGYGLIPKKISVISKDGIKEPKVDDHVSIHDGDTILFDKEKIGFNFYKGDQHEYHVPEEPDSEEEAMKRDSVTLRIFKGFTNMIYREE